MSLPPQRQTPGAKGLNGCYARKSLTARGARTHHMQDARVGGLRCAVFHRRRRSASSRHAVQAFAALRGSRADSSSDSHQVGCNAQDSVAATSCLSVLTASASLASVGSSVPSMMRSSEMEMPILAANRSSSFLCRASSVSRRMVSRFHSLLSSSSSESASLPAQSPFSNIMRPVASLRAFASSSAAFLSRRSFFHFANVSSVTGVRVPVSLWRSDSRKSSRVRALRGSLSARAFSACRCSRVLITKLKINVSCVVGEEIHR